MGPRILPALVGVVLIGALVWLALADQSGSPPTSEVLRSPPTDVPVTAAGLDSISAGARVEVKTESPRPADPPERIDEFASSQDLVKAHLAVASPRLQSLARMALLRLADDYAKRAEVARAKAPSLEAIMEELDARYGERLRRLASERLEKGEGALVVDQMNYDKRVASRPFVLWSGGERQFDKSMDVLVVIDGPDAELERIDAEFWNVRSMRLYEKATPFNQLPYEVRRSRILDFEASKSRGVGKASLLGIDGDDLRFMTVDPIRMTLVPVSR